MSFANAYGWPIFYAILTALVVVLAFRFKDRSPAAPVAASILAGLCALTDASHWLFRPQHMLFPICDAVACVFFTLLWRYDTKWWELVLAVLFLADLAAHVQFFGQSNSDQPTRYRYDLTLNLLYLCQLATVVGATFWRPKGAYA